MTEKGEVQLNKYAHNIFGMRKSTTSSTKAPSVTSSTTSEAALENEELKVLEHRQNNIFKKRYTALTAASSESQKSLQDQFADVLKNKSD